jgi:hypothetical protein
MKRILISTLVALTSTLALHAADSEAGFTQLFDGKSFEGWKVAEPEKKSWRIEDGVIIANGEPSHLFYVGDGKPFKDFEFKVDVMTEPGSNGGIYFHTAFQEKGWPEKGFECQVCANGYKDPRKTGSLYAVKDMSEAPAKDDEWFDYHIIVKGASVTTRINGKVAIEWTQPDGYKHPQFKGRVLSSGTFAIQGHDPGSRVEYKNIRVKPLED